MSWVTDDELYGAVDRCARKLIEMCAQATGDPNTTPKGSLPKTVVDSLRGDAEDFMFFEPTMLVEEYERVLEVARAIGENAVLAADIDETRNHLINWTGQAATDFKRQLKYLEEFCDRQQTDIVLGLQHLLTAFQLAVHARADYLELAEATIAAAEREIDKRSKRAAIAFVSVASEIVGSVLSLDPKSLLTGSIGLATKVGSEIAEYVIEGDEADIVVGNYLEYKRQMLVQYERELDNVNELLGNRLDAVVANAQPLQEPLPAHCDVGSPDFTYENFQSARGGDAAPIAPTVEDERRKYAEEQNEKQDSEIDRRLNHGDKGAI